MSKTIYTLWAESEKQNKDLPAVRWLEKKEIKECSYGEL